MVDEKIEFLGLFEGPDENAERARIYNEAVIRFPIDVKISSCYDLEADIKSIQDIINAAMQAKTNDDSKGTHRVQNRIIDAYTMRQNDLKQMFNEKQCERVQEQLESDEFFDTQYDNLERVKGLTEKSGDTTKYLVFGMLAIVVVISGVIIFKK